MIQIIAAKPLRQDTPSIQSPQRPQGSQGDLSKGRLLMRYLLILLSLGVLVGCMEKEPEVYPVTHETCGPEDPVKDVDVIDCVPAAI
jgi:hypothetical protein